MLRTEAEALTTKCCQGGLVVSVGGSCLATQCMSWRVVQTFTRLLGEDHLPEGMTPTGDGDPANDRIYAIDGSYWRKTRYDAANGLFYWRQEIMLAGGYCGLAGIPRELGQS